MFAKWFVAFVTSIGPLINYTPNADISLKVLPNDALT